MDKSADSKSPAKRSFLARYWWLMILLAIVVYFAAPDIRDVIKSFGGTASTDDSNSSWSKPAMPLLVTCHNSQIGKGRVLNVTNTSDAYLHGVVITMDAPDGQTISRTIETFAPHSALELGWMELSPWVIESGETATFSHPDFQPYSVTVP